MKNNPENPLPAELRPAEETSINEFLQNVMRTVSDGRQDPETGAETKSFTLPDGRLVSLKREGLAGQNMEPKDDPIAYMYVVEIKPSKDNIPEKQERKQTGYILYKDGRMEKAVSIGTFGQLEADYQEMGAEQLHRKREEAAEFERQLGLRTATEADMEEARGLFREIELLQEKEQGFNRTP